MDSTFKKSIELNLKIEKFLDIIGNSLLLFEKEIRNYLKGDCNSYESDLKTIEKLESQADELEIDIKVSLYKYMLIPDARADVLSLIKSLDNIIDVIEEITKDFYIQKPVFPDSLHESINELTVNSTKSADALLLAARSFFGEIGIINNYINKVNFYEHEVDVLEDKITHKIFNENLVKHLANKMQLKDFINKIARISDEAEQIGEKLTIFSIKREI